MRNITPHSAAQKLAHLLIVFSAAALPFLCWNARSGQLLIPTWAQGRADEFTATLRGHDQGFLSAAPSGNVALRFEGLDPQNHEHVTHVQVMYFRGAYSLYPRRVFAAPQRTVLDDGRDILGVGFNPSLQWMQQNGVQTVVTSAAGPDGRLGVGLSRVPPSGEGQ